MATMMNIAKLKPIILAALLSFHLAALADDAVPNSDSTKTFVKRFPSFVLPTCDLPKLKCRGLPMTVTAESSENRYGEVRIFRTIEGAGLIIDHQDDDVSSITIKESSVVLPNGIKVGDSIEHIEKILGLGVRRIDNGSIEYGDDETLSYLIFFANDEGRITYFSWGTYRD